MKFFFFFFPLTSCILNFVGADALKKKLDKFKKQTVTIHNDFIKNNNELKNIKIDIDRNSQKQIILNKRIKSGENVGRRLMFLLQEKIYLSPITKVINNLFFQSEDFVTKQIIREFFLKKVRLGINEYLLSFKTIAELNNELDDKLIIYKKKDSLAEKLIILEKKIAQVAKLQKKVKVDVKLKVKEKR